MSTPSSVVTQGKTRTENTAFTRRERILLFLISWTGYLAVRLIGPTLRWTLEIEEGDPATEFSDRVIYAFWHRCVFPALFRYRNRHIAVMTSSSFDGEYIARIIERFGFTSVRGSSTRGGAAALAGMRRELERGHSVAFTIDGPRGPRYVAKRGPVLLASKTGLPICCFHVALERAWTLNSWDALMIPKPFSRALVKISRFFFVPGELSPEQMQGYHEELQATLDRIRASAEARMVGETGRNA